MFDVFYSGKKPGVFAHERRADSIEQAQKLCRTRYFWWITYLADLSDFDFLWEPAPWQSNQRHAWPNQHQPDAGIYLVPKAGYVDTNYHSEPKIHHGVDQSYWYIPTDIDSTSIDSQWSPDPMDPPYIYHFPVEWGWDNIGGPEYRIPGATEHKFVTDFVTRTKPNFEAWHKLVPAHLSPELQRWRPCPSDPPYVYVFGNQWYPPEVMPTVEYRVPGATEKKYIAELTAKTLENRNNWKVLEACDWDYSWVPDPGDPPYIYVFGNQWWPAEKWPTVEYHVPGATERKYMDHPRAQLLPDLANWRNLSEHNHDFDYSWKPDPGDPPYRYVFGNQWHAAEIMPTVEWLHPDATPESPAKYIDWPKAELFPDARRWTVPPGIDPDTVDFSWVPDPGEPPYIYQFATQHQKTGGPVYTVPGATEIKYLEHVEIKIQTETVPIVEIDHMDGHAGHIANTIKTVRYFDNYRDTLIRIAKSLLGQHEFVWVCSSLCDYTNFDFTWHPEQWQQTMLHVFASDKQKFGDTFYMHVPTFAERAEKKALLEWYSVNFVPRRSVPRRPMPIVVHDNDSQVDAVKNTDWTGPLATFSTHDSVPGDLVTVPLWRTETKAITPLSNGAGSVIVPRTAKSVIRTQLYDYPYIDKTQRVLKDPPLDIVFVSNGEPCAESNYQCLLEATKHLPNRLHRVDRILGRVQSEQAGAHLSQTAWYFRVPAKLTVLPNFDWSWQPDRMQQAKHYIFHATNAITGLTYGHMATIAYNRQLVLQTQGQTLDFATEQLHEVVPVLCGTAKATDSPWTAWRTAFREALKLRASLPNIENEYRLNQWLAVPVSTDSWTNWGAHDALEYYNAVDGDFEALRKTYEWNWLAQYAQSKRNLSLT